MTQCVNSLVLSAQVSCRAFLPGVWQCLFLNPSLTPDLLSASLAWLCLMAQLAVTRLAICFSLALPTKGHVERAVLFDSVKDITTANAYSFTKFQKKKKMGDKKMVELA